MIVSIIIGGLVGWLASIVMKTNAQMVMIANVLVGMRRCSKGWASGSLGCSACQQSQQPDRGVDR